MQQLEELLNTSIAQYLAILDHFRAMGRGLVTGQTGTLDDSLQRLEVLQHEATCTDRVLLERLRLAGPAAEKNPLFWHRLQLLQEVVEQIRLLDAKTKAKMALDFDELTQLKGGQAAMSGYRLSGGQRGSVVRSSC